MKSKSPVVWAWTLAATLLSGAAAARGKTAAAMISDLKGAVSWGPNRKGSPDILDELFPGDALNIPAGASAVLVYFKGCSKETILGPAKLRVGETSSLLADKSSPEISKIRCEPPGASLPKTAGSVPEALVLMGVHSAGAPGEAAFRAAVEKAPDDVSARLAFASFFENRGRLAEAAEQYQGAGELRPDSRATREKLALVRAAGKLLSLEGAPPGPSQDAAAADIPDAALQARIKALLQAQPKGGSRNRLALARMLLEAEKDGAPNEARARGVMALAERSRKGLQ